MRNIYKFGKCDYCENSKEVVRPTPFMADIPAMMCEHCWNITEKEYAACNGEYIGKFEDGPGYKEVKPLIEAKEQKQKLFNDFIEHLRIEFEMGCLDATLETVTSDGMDMKAFNDYLKDDISYAAECSE